MTDLDPMHFYDILKAHKQSVNAIEQFSYILPDDDDLSPLIRVLSDSIALSISNLEVAYIKLMAASTDA